MKSLFLRAGRLAAIVAGCAVLLPAADQGLGAELRLRSGIEIASNKDNLQRHFIGFSLAGTYGLSVGTVSAELGYQFKPGNGYKAPYLAPAAGMPVVNDANSTDTRRNSLEGLTARFGFERDLPWQDFSWQAGVQITSGKFRQEYIADIGDTKNATYEDTYNGTPSKTTMGFNPFIGLRFKAGSISTFEVNLISLSYKAINFEHTPGAALVGGSTDVAGSHLVYAGDKLVEKSRNALHIEFGYSFRF